jgi:hypothetical protein
VGDIKASILQQTFFESLTRATDEEENTTADLERHYWVCAIAKGCLPKCFRLALQKFTIESLSSFSK